MATSGTLACPGCVGSHSSSFRPEDLADRDPSECARSLLAAVEHLAVALAADPAVQLLLNMSHTPESTVAFALDRGPTSTLLSGPSASVQLLREFGPDPGAATLAHITDRVQAWREADPDGPFWIGEVAAKKMSSSLTWPPFWIPSSPWPTTRCPCCQALADYRQLTTGLSRLAKPADPEPDPSTTWGSFVSGLRTEIHGIAAASLASRPDAVGRPESRSLFCKLIGHKWAPEPECQCRRCGWMHFWQGCICRDCGEDRAAHHTQVGCVCITCGRAHDWTRIHRTPGAGHGLELHLCKSCGALSSTWVHRSISGWGT